MISPLEPTKRKLEEVDPKLTETILVTMKPTANDKNLHFLVHLPPVHSVYPVLCQPLVLEPCTS